MGDFFLCLSACLSAWFCLCLCLYLSLTVSARLPASLPASLPVYLPACLPVCLPVCLSLSSISFAGASLWNSLPQNIKSCISVPCFKRNLHKYMYENDLSSNLDRFGQICLSKSRFLKNYCCVHLCPSKKFSSDVSAHLCELCETALISSLFVLIISVLV